MLLIKTAEQVSRDEIAKAMTEGKQGNEEPEKKKKKSALEREKKIVLMEHRKEIEGDEWRRVRSYRQ